MIHDFYHTMRGADLGMVHNILFRARDADRSDTAAVVNDLFTHGALAGDEADHPGRPGRNSVVE